MRYKLRKRYKFSIKIISLILFVILFMISTGYAIFSQDLKIIGSNIKASRTLKTVTFYVPATAHQTTNHEFDNPGRALNRYNRTDTDLYASTESSSLGSFGTYTRYITYYFQNIGNANSYLANGAPANLPTDRTVTFTSCTLYATMGVWQDSGSTTGTQKGDARIISPVSMGTPEDVELNKGEKWGGTYSSAITIPARGSEVSCQFRGRCTAKGAVNSRYIKAAVTNLYLKIEAQYYE